MTDKEEFNKITTTIGCLNSLSKAQMADALNGCLQLAIEHFLEHGDTRYLNILVNCLDGKNKQLILAELKLILPITYKTTTKQFMKNKKRKVKPFDVKNIKPFTRVALSNNDSGFIEVEGKLTPSELCDFIADSLTLYRHSFNSEQISEIELILNRMPNKK